MSPRGEIAIPMAGLEDAKAAHVNPRGRARAPLHLPDLDDRADVLPPPPSRAGILQTVRPAKLILQPGGTPVALLHVFFNSIRLRCPRSRPGGIVLFVNSLGSNRLPMCYVLLDRTVAFWTIWRTGH